MSWMRLSIIVAATFLAAGSLSAWWLHTGSMIDSGLVVATERIPLHFGVSIVVAGVASVAAAWVLTSRNKLLGLPRRQFSIRIVLLALVFFSVVFAMASRGINRVQNSRTLSQQEISLIGTWEREMTELNTRQRDSHVQV